MKEENKKKKTEEKDPLKYERPSLLPNIKTSYIWRIVLFVCVLQLLRWLQNKYPGNQFFLLAGWLMIIYAIYWAMSKNT